MSKKLYRIPENGKIAGVCAGLAEYLNIDVTMVRVLAVIAIFVTSGFAILAYFIAALVIPVKGEELKKEDYGKRAEELVKDTADRINSPWVRNGFGVGLVILGVWFILRAIWPGWLDISWSVIWSLLLIVIGVFIITRGRRG